MIGLMNGSVDVFFLVWSAWRAFSSKGSWS